MTTKGMRINHPGPKPEPIPAKRFMRKVRFDTSGCWTWVGSISSGGYGGFRIGGRSPGFAAKAHRVSYEMFVGPIPDGLQLDHLCRNRACVNVKHLEPVTLRENNLRSDNVGGRNARVTHCPKGHEYAGDNLIYSAKYGRRCRACKNEEGRERSARAIAAGAHLRHTLTCVDCGAQRKSIRHPDSALAPKRCDSCARAARKRAGVETHSLAVQP